MLALLNSRTRHRYTGAYLFDSPRLVNYALFDRENPGVRSMGDLLLRDSYCAIVEENRSHFVTNDSLHDDRLHAHPNQRLTMAYHGYALREPGGPCFGSLCHWDVRPRLLAASEVPLLRTAADLVARAVLQDPSLDTLLQNRAATARRRPAPGDSTAR